MFSRRSLSKKVRFQDERNTALIAANLTESAPVGILKASKGDKRKARHVPSDREFEDIQSRLLALEIAVSEALAVSKPGSKSQRDPSRALGLQAKQLTRFKPSSSRTSAIEDSARRLASENAQLVRRLKQAEAASQSRDQKLSRRLSNIEVTLQQPSSDTRSSDMIGEEEDRMMREAVLLSQITELQRGLADAKRLDSALIASAQSTNGHQLPPPYHA
ncbi:hypothetical protein BKA70DRAFT_1246078 [Coprinopsis sp. MPI-PUGE-AT-0042]|nr:hypothetical protein BKA70DRAFT_1246078 [Coprinopsis sp. MPI-PUGE-AT-0042]